MTADRYTKAVLTVIAGCLLWMCVMGAGSPLQAQRRQDRPERDRVDAEAVALTAIKTIAQPVIVVGTGTMDRQGNIEVSFNRDTRRTEPAFDVRLPYSPFYPMAVEITAVRKHGSWESLRTAVDDAPVRNQPGNGR